jgi:protein TonB
LAVSLVGHLLLLWPAVTLYRQGVTAQSLSVVLQPGTSRAPVETSAAASPAPPRVREASRERPMLARNDGPQTQIPINPQPPADLSPSAANGQTRSESPAPASAAGTRATIQAADPGGGLDADGVRQYRMALAVEARRFKRYPARALADEISGTVEVRVAVAAGGQSQEVALARSSGYGALDEAALDMLRKAAPRTAVPELLRRRAFVINLPVVFDVASE